MAISNNFKVINGREQLRRSCAIRKKTGEKMTLFNPNLDIVDDGLDSVIFDVGYRPNFLSLTNFTLIKKEGKWGILNCDLKTVVPPQYDRITYKNRCFYKVLKEGKEFWIDTSGQVVFGSKNFSEISDYSVKGKWLAWDVGKPPADWTSYSEYTGIGKVYLIDASGKVLSKIEGRDPWSKYYLTVNGKILVEGKTQELYDPATGKSVYTTGMHRILTWNDAALVVGCYSLKKEQAAISALNLSTIIPYADYWGDIYASREVVQPEKGRKPGIYVHPVKKDKKGISPYERINDFGGTLVGGYYTTDGIKFWEDGE